MEYILEITGLSDHPSGLERKAQVDSLEIYNSSVRVKFKVIYSLNGVELVSAAPAKMYAFSTTPEDYATLVSIQANGNATIYQNLLALIEQQVTTLIEEGKTD